LLIISLIRVGLPPSGSYINEKTGSFRSLAILRASDVKVAKALFYRLLSAKFRRYELLLLPDLPTFGTPTTTP
jgi:hypothetical protein